MMKHFLTLKDLSKEEMLYLLNKAVGIKKDPQKYATALKDKTLLMIFEKPSLRTRLSFEVAMTQMGGHAIFYSSADSPLGKKETIEDTAKISSRYVDLIMARLYEHSSIEALAKNSSVPVINALTNYSHPCQILGDLLTIKEKKGALKGLKLVYFGDSRNNVTHSLIFGAALAGMEIVVCCPNNDTFLPLPEVMNSAKTMGGNTQIVHDPLEAIKDADIVYTDSWMSYHIPEKEKTARVEALKPYQVSHKLMTKAKPDAIFMHCLPAARGDEVTAEVLDGPQSVVVDQAENRLYIQKAIMLWLLGKV